MTINRALVGAASAVSLLLVIAVVLVLARSAEIRERLERSTTIVLNDEDAAHRIAASVQSQYIAAFQFVELGEPRLRDRFLVDGTNAYDAMRQYLVREIHPDERRLVEQLKSSYQVFEVTALEAMNLRSAGRTDSARSRLLSASRQIEQVREHAQDLLDVRRRERLRLQELQSEGLNQLFILAPLIAFASLLGLFGLVRLQRRYFVRPMEDLTAMVKRLGSGDLEARADVTGYHEIAALASGLNSMAAGISAARAEASTAGERLRDIVEDVNALLWEQDALTQQIQFVSGGALALLGYPAQDWYTDRDIWQKVLHPLDRDRVAAERLAAVESGAGAELEYRARAANESVLWLHEVIRVVRDADRISLRGVVVDVTERRLLEEQLRQSQKMDAIGRLAGGIAHDFNNLLTAMRGHAHLLLEEIPESDSKHQDVAEILAAADRAASLTRQLLVFSRKQVLETAVLDVNEIVRTMRAMLSRLIGEHIELRIELAPDAGNIRGNPGQVEQIIMNLVVNARDAMPGGGVLHIRTEGPTPAHSGAEGIASCAMIEVSDTGCGMTPEVRARVFEPFFTTKEVGRGTGLGLATVYGIVQQSGGSVEVESEVDVGTTFRVFLPSVDESADVVQVRSTEIAGAAGGQTILVVEDDQSVRNLTARILKANGYIVLEAQTGEEALRICGEAGDRIQLVLTDVVMPGMSGPALAAQLGELLPGVPVVFMSGYAEHDYPGESLETGSAGFIEKPYHPAALVAKVRAMLDAAGSQAR